MSGATPTGTKPTGSTALADQVRRVAHLRAAKQLSDEALQRRRTLWEEQNADLVSEARELKTRLTEEELRLRDMTVAEYRATGKKKPTEGVGVRLSIDVVYEEAKAFEWARDNGLCLALDNKAFRALALHQDFDFVQRLQTAAGTIATDLSFALREQPPAEVPAAEEPADRGELEAVGGLDADDEEGEPF